MYNILILQQLVNFLALIRFPLILLEQYRLSVGREVTRIGKVKTVMMNNFTKINKTNNQLSP